MQVLVASSGGAMGWAMALGHHWGGGKIYGGNIDFLINHFWDTSFMPSGWLVTVASQLRWIYSQPWDEAKVMVRMASQPGYKVN